MNVKTAACACPACRHAARRSLEAALGALTFELARAALIDTAELRIGTLDRFCALKGVR